MSNTVNLVNIKEYPEKSSTVLKQVAETSERNVVELGNTKNPDLLIK